MKAYKITCLISMVLSNEDNVDRNYKENGVLKKEKEKKNNKIKSVFIVD